MNTKVKAAIIAAAKATPNVEICGLIYRTDTEVRVVSCPNITIDAEGPARAFEIDEQYYIHTAGLGKILGVYHSHAVDGSAALSEADLDLARVLEIPIYLFANRDESWHSYIPPTYRPPLIGRPWIWGESDCYETVRLYYRLAHNVYLTDYDRDETFENAEHSAITRYIETEGFMSVPTNTIREGDVLLFRTPGTAYPHHLGVFTGRSQVLHHPRGLLSRIDLFNSNWLKRLSAVLRYQGKTSAP